jgi:hypothetical protein
MPHSSTPKDYLPSSIELAYGRHTQDVQHGALMVAFYLEQIGLADWTSRVMGYLRMFDGIESWLEPGDTEAVDFVRQMLFKNSRKTTSEDVSARRFRLAVCMANAPVASYGAAFKIQRAPDDQMRSIWWNPLEQSWLAFLAQRESLPDYTRLYLSRASASRASPESLTEYLMER